MAWRRGRGGKGGRGAAEQVAELPAASHHPAALPTTLPARSVLRMMAHQPVVGSLFAGIAGLSLRWPDNKTSVPFDWVAVQFLWAMKGVGSAHVDIQRRRTHL